MLLVVVLVVVLVLSIRRLPGIFCHCSTRLLLVLLRMLLLECRLGCSCVMFFQVLGCLLLCFVEFLVLVLF